MNDVNIFRRHCQHMIGPVTYDYIKQTGTDSHDLIIIKMLRKKGKATQHNRKDKSTQHNSPKAGIFQRKTCLGWDSCTHTFPGWVQRPRHEQDHTLFLLYCESSAISCECTTCTCTYTCTVAAHAHVHVQWLKW